jgi:alpha-glucosidase (family GH31 glycosyl hydrolase)
MESCPAAPDDQTHAIACEGVTQESGAVALTLRLSSGEPLPFKVEFLTDHMVRLRANPAGGFEKTLPEKDGFLKSNWDGIDVKVIESEDHFRIVGKNATVQINRDPFSFSFYLKDERLTGSSQQNGLRMEDGKFILTMEAPENEKFLGLGYQGARYVYPFAPDWAPLDHRGRSIQMTGLTSHRSYHIPFFQSSRGYGFFLNTIVKTDWDMAKTDKSHYSIVIDENKLDLYLIAGPTFRDITERYTQLAGRPPLMPKWTMGAKDEPRLMSIGVRETDSPITSDEAQWNKDGVETKARARGDVDPYVGMNVRWFDQKEIENAARHIRKHHIPCDYFHLDSAWQTVRGSLEWVSQIHDPKGMLALLNELHFKPGLWQRATIEYGDYPLFKEAEEKGYLVSGPDGKPFRGAMNDERKVLVDFTNPEAVAWWNGKTSKLVEMGAKAFKLDSESGGYSEAMPEARHIRFSNGMTGAQMENYHGALYAKAVFDGMREALEGERVVQHVFYPTYFASGRYPVCALGDRGHRCTEENRMAIAMTMGLAGVPLWMGFDYTLFGLPHVSKVFNIRLMPYTYSHWRLAHEKGLPLIRAMVLDYQDDPESYNADTQFMYGESFLIAPPAPGAADSRQISPPLGDIRGMEGPWEEGKNWRRVYLPKGEWINYHTKEKYTGPEWRYFQARPDALPTLVRGGAIIPFGPMMEYIEERPADSLTLEIFPCGSSSFTLYEDDGKTYGYESGEFARTEIKCVEHKKGVDVEIAAAVGSYPGMVLDREYLLKVFGTVCPESILVGGEALDRLDSEADLQETPSGWCYQKDGDYSRIVVVKLAHAKTDKPVKLQLVGGHPTNYYF